MSRICAFILTVYTGWAVVHCGVGMVATLVGGGVVALLTRHKPKRQKVSESEVGSRPHAD